MSKRLQDRVAIITGSSSGLGRAISLAYTAEGAHVVCSDLQPHPRQSPKTAAEVADYAYDTSSTPTHELIIKNGGRAIFVKCDVGVEQEVEALVIAAVKEYGKLDIMVNNAGWAPESSITTEIPLRCHDMPTEIFDKTLAINTRGVFLGCKYACKQMLKQRMVKSEAELEEDGGWIVNLASILGLVGFNSLREYNLEVDLRAVLLTALLAGYCASKGAVVQLTKNVALDYAPERIHCNAMCPGCKRIE